MRVLRSIIICPYCNVLPNNALKNELNFSKGWKNKNKFPPYRTFFHTTFAVSQLPGCTRTFKLLNEVVRETYNCPWLKTYCSKYISTFSCVCPWALLFIIIQKVSFIGNCLLLNENGKVESAGDRSTLGHNILRLHSTPVIISKSSALCTCSSQLVVSHSAAQVHWCWVTT